MKEPSTDHRTRITRMLIRRAFLDLLAQKPIQSITVKELCAAAGIHRGTFYAHYSDVYALLTQIEDDMMQSMTVLLEPIYTRVSSENSLVEVCTGIFQYLKENADFCTVILGEYSDKRFLDKLLRLGKETCLAVYAQYFQGASQRQLEYFYAFVSEGCIGMVKQWMHDGMALDVQELAQMTEEIMLRGIGFFTPKPTA